MPLNWFECALCGAKRETFKREPKCNHNQEEEGEPLPLTPMKKLLTAPETKFMEPTNKEKGKSVMQGQKQILMARAKEHARQNDYAELVQTNSPEMAKAVGWVREDGTIRRKVDDL